ncbi:hypothetical protein CONPUDRAFT_160887 [Coniophora puteana RWD-64-598 SS2]|uniref:F-box domain-containing protein n=1 Tax=Coniophora puteana (strain RWD-64-598) TaxID=741705 RepID=A0A5M3N3P7_CONPW|nr:uncharacterized protein CONPUDRAFT_160887 [Coniophora puteana RWD-64-598 SS2]EIW85978.1 hypothetical protein CONPUDRAFT_160887 [Coniophora puteana RWD-64-598 SS2]
MERALNLPEIREHICSQVSSKASLAALARTCSAFEKLALDKLWSGDPHAISFSDLRKALPGVFVTDADGEIVDLRLRSPKDWDRLFALTTRIRFLTFDEGPYIIESVLEMLLSPPSSLQKAFPKLRSLDVDGYDPNLLQTYIPFLSSHLREFSYRGHPQNIRIPLQVLPDKCAYLQFLGVTEGDWPSKDGELICMIKEVSAAVIRLPLLVSLRCPDLEPHALLHISRSPCLRELRLTDLQETTPVVVHADPTPLRFEAIEELELRMMSFESALAVLRRLQTLPRTLELQEPMSRFKDLTELREVLAILNRCERRKYDLEELEIHGFTVNHPTNLDVRYNMDFFRLLGRHRKLRSLELWVEFEIGLSPYDVAELALAHPYLKKLIFSPMSDTVLSTQSLSILSNKCPKLTYIEAPITDSQCDRDGLFELDNGSTPSASHSSLTSLDLITSQFRDMAFLTQTLEASFPSLTELSLHELSFKHCSDPMPFTSATMEPLCCLTHLTRLRIDVTNRRVEIAEADVLRLARSLPSLKVLYISGATAVGFDGLAMSLDSILNLADTHQSLVEITLPFRAFLADRSNSRHRFRARRTLPRNRTLKDIHLLVSSKPSREYLADLAIVVLTACARLSTFYLTTPRASPEPPIPLFDAIEAFRKVERVQGLSKMRYEDGELGGEKGDALILVALGLELLNVFLTKLMSPSALEAMTAADSYLTLEELTVPFQALLSDRSNSEKRFMESRATSPNRTLRAVRFVVLSRPSNAYLVDLAIVMATKYVRIENLSLKMPRWCSPLTPHADFQEPRRTVVPEIEHNQSVQESDDDW